MDLTVQMTIRVVNNKTGKYYELYAEEPVLPELTRQESMQRLLDGLLASRYPSHFLEVENG